MRGDENTQDDVWSYIPLDQRVPVAHPLRPMRVMVDAVLVELSPQFHRLYSRVGLPSIPPEQLLRALLLQILYSVRSERLLMEQLDYNLLFRWFVGLKADGRVWTRRCSPRTASGCWMARSRGPSSTGWWPRRASAACCRMSTSQWTAR